MRPLIALLAFAAVFPFCGCSSLKMASLQDARVLPEGGFAFSGEIASAYYENNALLRVGRSRDSVLADAWKRDTSAYYSLSLVPMLGVSFAFGAGGGWELGFGGDVAPLGEESWAMDAYVKKRVYSGEGNFVTLFTRGSFGHSVGYLDPYGSGLYKSDYRYTTQTVGLDFQALYLGRLARKLGYYLNAGPSVGKLGYALEGRDGRADRSGTLPIYGFRGHAGLVFELNHFELAWETGLQAFNYGMTPSLGVRVAFKNDWRH
jgi:hypothetical protein